MTQTEAITNLQALKRYAPFRYWCAAEINGEWHTFDSRRKMLNAIKRAGLAQANILTAQ